MNDALIKNWHSRVKPTDEVYVLGDFALCPWRRALSFAQSLSGRKHLIAGNHDKPLRRKAEFCAAFETVRDLAEIKVPSLGAYHDEQRIVLCHFAMLTWNKSHHGAWQLHGHSHGSLKDEPNALRLDVGVDVWNFAPVSFEEIRARMTKKTWKPVDHHGAD